MIVLVTLNSGQGVNLGPNFTLSVNTGTIIPNTATLNQLLSGIYATVDNAATSVTITSLGSCTNSLVLNINSITTTTTTAAPTTTTTTAAPTTTTTTTTAAPTTTTTAAPNCQQYTLTNNDEFSDFYDFQSCDGTQNNNVELQGGGGSVTICARAGTVTAGGAISVSAAQGTCT